MAIQVIVDDVRPRISSRAVTAFWASCRHAYCTNANPRCRWFSAVPPLFSSGRLTCECAVRVIEFIESECDWRFDFECAVRGVGVLCFKVGGWFTCENGDATSERVVRHSNTNCYLTFKHQLPPASE